MRAFSTIAYQNMLYQIDAIVEMFLMDEYEIFYQSNIVVSIWYLYEQWTVVRLNQPQNVEVHSSENRSDVM